jgi:serine/threonine-protein kinase
MPWSPRFSPDGRRLAFGAYAPGRDSSDIWVADLAAGTVARLTTVGLDANEPVWSPDGRQLAFDQLAPGGKDLYVQPVDGGPGRLLARRPGTQWTTDWTPDGTAVLFTEATEATGLDVWVQPLDGGAARPYLTSTANELGARVSPDGRWIAYQSDESGRWEVYVEAFATPGAKTPVSAGGGAFPAWGRDGRTLYFWQDDALVAARLETGGTGGPRVVERTRRPLQVPYVGNILSMYDVAPDGRRLALVSGEERARRLVVALDALGDLRGASSAR